MSPSPASSERREPFAICLIAVNALIAGTSGSLAKSLIEAGWSTGAINVIRLTVAGVVLIPSSIWLVARRRTRLREQLPGIVALGVFGFAGLIICYYNALARLPVGVCLLLTSLSPVLVLVWVWRRHGERPSRTTVLGAMASFTGLVLVVVGLDMGAPSVEGVLWGLGGALCLACYFVASERMMTTAMPPSVLACAGLLVAAAVIAALAVIRLLPFEMGADAVVLASQDVAAWVPLALISFVSTTFVFVVAFITLQILGARVTSFFSLLEPVFAFLIAWVLLGETPLSLQLAGGALILTGLVVIRNDSSARVRRAVKADDSPTPFPATPT